MPLPRPADIPKGYTFLREGAQCAVVLAESAEAISLALFSREDCTPMAAGGRGQVYRFALTTQSSEAGKAGASSHGVLRPLKRGGLPSLVIRDHFVLRNRALEEFRVHAAIHAAGVPSPQPLGVVWRQKGLLYSGALATRFVKGDSLAALLAAEEDPSGALHAAGKAIRQLHEAGALHRDLHPANILVARGVAYLLDFDGARLLAHASPRQRASNLLRLRRALVKLGRPEAFDVLMEGYGAPLEAAAWQQALAAIHELKVRNPGRK
jgi:tRNA A-37 threonylcarbamoyl transferase component Bud32